MSGIKLLVSDHHGVYIPKVFMEVYNYEDWNINENEADSLSKGLDQDYYWDEWDYVLQKAEHKDENGNVWHLWQDGDLWAYCPELMSDEEYEQFFGEAREQ